MNIYLILAFIINCTMIAGQLWAFIGLKRKVDILKYYTYFQNALSLIVSVILCVYLALSFAGVSGVPEFVRGLRYMATTGLLFMMVIYLVLLLPSGKKKNLLSSDDFLDKFSPKIANVILHIYCPLTSLISFVWFERGIVLHSSIWTGLVAIPSVVYWVGYLFLTLTKLWVPPYEFTPSNTPKKRVIDALLYVLIPVSFIGLSVVLWLIK